MISSGPGLRAWSLRTSEAAVVRLNPDCIMRFGLTKPFLDTQAFIQIDEAEFVRIRDRRAKLVRALSIEIRLDLVIENFDELENQLRQGTFRAAISERGWEASFQEIQRLNRRLVNLLTTCRLYLDQVSHNIGEICGQDSEVYRGYHERRAAEYDAHFGYRFLEALRNYVQHRDLPINVLAYRVERSEEAPVSRVIHSLSPKIRVAGLREDPKFKRSVLTEVDALGDELDLKPLVREYVGCIGRVHSYLRDQLASDVRTWDMGVEDLLKHYATTTGEDIFGVVAVMESEPRRFPEMVHVGTDIIRARHDLVSKNRNLKSLASYVIAH